MGTVLEAAVGQIQARVQELEPAVQEHRELEEVLEVIGANGGGVPVTQTVMADAVESLNRVTAQERERTRRNERHGQPYGKRQGKRGRPAGAGKTLEKVQNVLGNHSDRGLTVNEIAAMLEMKPNYLYRA